MDLEIYKLYISNDIFKFYLYCLLTVLTIFLDFLEEPSIW